MMNEKRENGRASKNVYPSLWFRNFSDELCRQMSYIINKERGLSLSLIVKVFKVIEEKILNSPKESNTQYNVTGYC